MTDPRVLVPTSDGLSVRREDSSNASSLSRRCTCNTTTQDQVCVADDCIFPHVLLYTSSRQKEPDEPDREYKSDLTVEFLHKLEKDWDL